MAESPEKYLRVGEKELLSLLSERDHMRKQIKELQAYNTRLVLALRKTKKKEEPTAPPWGLDMNDG